MTDIRIIGTIIIAALLGIGLWLAHDFGFSSLYVYVPLALLSVLFGFVMLVLGSWGE
jgi:hypothetical protein